MEMEVFLSRGSIIQHGRWIYELHYSTVWTGRRWYKDGGNDCLTCSVLTLKIWQLVKFNMTVKPSQLIWNTQFHIIVHLATSQLEEKNIFKSGKNEEWRKRLFNMFFGGLKDLSVDTKLMWLSHLVFTLLYTVNCQQNGQTTHGTIESDLEHHLTLYCSLYCFTGSLTLVCYNNMHTHCHSLLYEKSILTAWKLVETTDRSTSANCFTLLHKLMKWMTQIVVESCQTGVFEREQYHRDWLCHKTLQCLTWVFSLCF